MYILQLQQLQEQPTDSLPLLAVAHSEGIELLKELYVNELVTPYEEVLENGYTVRKEFRKGGPLEWYIAPEDTTQMFVDVGTKDQRMEQLVAEFKKRVEIEWLSMVSNTHACNDREQLQKIIRMEV